MKVFLVGLPGSGKSFLGERLADAAHVPFIDLDRVIERESQSAIAQIFTEKGEDYFRNLEATALRQQGKAASFVMACGGGTPCFHHNMTFMNETGTSIYVNVPVTTISSRLSGKGKERRPLLASAEDRHATELKLIELLKKREQFYRQASITVTEHTTVSQILEQLA